MPRRAISSVNDEEHAWSAVQRARGDERAPPPLALDQPGVRQLLDRLAHRHPADPEAVAELGLGEQGVAGRGVVDQLAQVCLDVAIAGAAR